MRESMQQDAVLSKYIDGICRVFQLGNPLSAAVPASGGRLHHVWRLRTSEGEFALKLLNENIMKKETALAAYERSEFVARSFSAQGVPAVTALFLDGTCVKHLDGHAFMVFRWIEGQAHSVGTIDASRAAKMGEVLGTIHGIKLDADDFKYLGKAVDADQWTRILIDTKAAAKGHPVAARLDANARNLALWAEQACTVNEPLQRNLVLSHGDLDQHNVIWANNSEPAIVDWEMVSLQNPSVELLNLCLDWSGFPDRVPDKEAFIACIDAYRKLNAGRTQLENFDTAANGEIAYFLRWLSYSLERISDASAEENEIALTEAGNALRSLRLFDECKSMIRSWFD